jgi:hypothetical protein
VPITAGVDGSGTVVTLQQSYNNSVPSPEILTDGTNGALTIQEGVSDSNDTLVVNNMAGTSTWHVQGGGEMRLIHTAVEDSDHSFEIDHFADGMADSKAIDIVYETGDISALAEESAILINVDKTASVGGNVNGIVSLATEGSANCTALEAGAQVDVLKQLSGSFSDPSTGNVDNNGSTVSVGSLSGVNLFASDNDYLIVANILSFEEIEFLMSQFASGSGIAPEFEYQTVGPVWTQFFPTDGTNGLRNNGVIAWTISDIPGQVLDGGVYKIRITRTRNSLATVPQAINNGIKVVVAEEFGWDKNADLTVNDISMKGGIYSPSFPNNWLDFDSTGDVKMNSQDEIRLVSTNATVVTASSVNVMTTLGMNMNSKKITSLLDPTSAQDAATKAYIDSLLGSVTTYSGVTAGDGTNNVTLDGNRPHYVVNGNVCHMEIELRWTSIGSASGDLRISLPHTVVTGGGGPVRWVNLNALAGEQLSFHTQNGWDYCVITRDHQKTTYVQVSDFTATRHIAGNLTYFI